MGQIPRGGIAAGLGEAEVEDLHHAVRRDLDIGRFEIAVHDALLVRGVEGIGDLPSNRQRVGDRHWSARDPLREGDSLHQLQYERTDEAPASAGPVSIP